MPASMAPKSRRLKWTYDDVNRRTPAWRSWKVQTGEDRARTGQSGPHRIAVEPLQTDV